MVSAFISHSTSDATFVRELADSLERGGEIKIFEATRSIAYGQDILAQIQKALETHDFVLLILSPDSVASAHVHEEYLDALWEQTNTGRTKLLPVLYRDCTIPRFLRSKKYFDLRQNHLEGFRQIRAHLLSQDPKSQPPTRFNHLPVRPPIFIGRERELAALHTRLTQPGAVVHVSEMPGRGKTTLALEFAHRHQTDFEAVYWLSCLSGSLASIAADLARILSLKLDGDTPQVVTELKTHLASKRCLLILDNVEVEAPGQLIPGGGTSVLITTRRGDLKFLRSHKALSLPLFTEEQCFAFFRDQLGDRAVDSHKDECAKLFTRLGHLPLAISIAAALIKEDPRYTIASFARKLPADVTELISDAISTLGEAARKLLTAMSVCAGEGFALDLAAQIAAFEEEASLEALHPLVTRSLVEELNRDGRRYRLHAVVREAAASVDGTLSHVHAQLILERFERWEANWHRCEQDLPDFRIALEWGIANAIANPAFHLDKLAIHGYSLTVRIGRPAEALEICIQMTALTGKKNDRAGLQTWLGNQAVILQTWGRLDEALALHKQKEAICLELGNKHGLQATYGNQAVILQARGHLDEALALQKQKEAICLELADKDGLQATYGNQALILKAWGRLDEALALHKQEETICLELGNKDGLQASYGNQALILRDRGHLDEALSLLKQKEAICLELGNKDSLQRGYTNQALILGDRGHLDEALALHKQQEAICLKLGNKDGLQISYGNQALILKDQGRLDEALALHKQEEAICLELGNKAGLGYCYWNWGLLERQRGNHDIEHEKLTAALALFEELRMPGERDEVQAELAKTRATGTS